MDLENINNDTLQKKNRIQKIWIISLAIAIGLILLADIGGGFFAYKYGMKKHRASMHRADSLIKYYSSQYVTYWGSNAEGDQIIRQKEKKEKENLAYSDSIQNVMNHFSNCGIVCFGANVPKIEKALSKYHSYETRHLRSGIRDIMVAILGDSGFINLKRVFIKTSSQIKKEFLRNTTQISWLRKVFDAPNVADIQLLPYLRGTMPKKEYVSDYEKWRKIHTGTAPVKNLQDHPQWEKWSNDFMKKYPKAFASKDQLADDYKRWLMVKKLGKQAANDLAELITAWNGLQPK